MKLLISRSPLPAESFMGYVLRLTERNGYETPSWILKMAGLEYRQLHQSCAFVFNPGEGLKALARVTGAGEATLRHLTCPKVNGLTSCLFFGRPVAQYAIRPAHPKLCP